ncbi:MAG: PPC domain-containing DNA-binding protein, partial [Prochlorococcaceae cyanobacterium]
MRSVPLHLEPGSDLRRSLEQLAQEQNASGFVLGVVGNLAQAAFQCPGKIAPTVLRGELEIITLQGTLSPEGVHLHLSLSDGECRVWGGHLEPGSRVLKGADLLVGLLDTPGQAPALASRPTTGAAGTEAAGDEASTNEPLEPRVTIAVRSG